MYLLKSLLLLFCLKLCFNVYANAQMDTMMNNDVLPLKIVSDDLEDHAVLRKVAEDVKFPLSDEVKKLIKSMRHYVANDNQGDGTFTVGLAAPQIGYSYKIFLFQIPQELADKHKIDPVELSVLINASYSPTVNSKEVLLWEGCLSVLNTMGEAKRYSEIEYTGYTEDGKKVQKVVSGLLAQIIQHETDHTYGILFKDKVPENKKLHSIEEAIANRKS
ncbi:MAG: peptide deformylase [Legionellales bacterium]|nr:peptide deformylase [Legionellales bacterium]